MAARHSAEVVTNNNVGGTPSRKRLRLATEESPQHHHHHQMTLSKWDSWASSHSGGSPNSQGLPDSRSSSDSISLSGSSSDADSAKCSPAPEINGAGPFPVTLTVALPKINAAMSSSAAVLNTPPVISGGDLRPLLVRPSTNLNIIEENSSPTATVVTTSSAPWHIQDFDGLTAGFDGSLSGLSDLTGPGYMNDMMEFVKRQGSHQTAVTNVTGENYFQYILMSATSAAVKLHEEPLTYLNQGQSYEIKCKKLGMEGGVSSRLYKTLVRIGFHDRRQKFQERELLQQWKQMHTTDKLIDADIPMSYNVFNVKTDPLSTYIEFVWDPAKNTSIFIRVNCISTEFTARKHGGEKGVPFRLQVDTFTYGETGNVQDAKHVHSAYAQIKVFKTKGADRKNKTDRERAEKRADKEKYQPAYDYTILTETFPVDVYEYDAQQQQQQQQQQQHNNHSSPNHEQQQQQQINRPPTNAHVILGRPNSGPPNSNGSVGNDVESVVSSQGGLSSPTPSNEEQPTGFDTLPPDATPSETVDWLRRQRFSSHVKTFGNFSGTDILRLTRDDLIQICGIADGIRLYNALQYKKVTPKLTVYMCVPGAPAYHAVFLVALNLTELVQKVCELIQVQASQIFDVYCQGPDGINVHVNDEVVQNLPDKSRFLIDAMKCGEESECYRILLKSAGETQATSS